MAGMLSMSMALAGCGWLQSAAIDGNRSQSVAIDGQTRGAAGVRALPLANSLRATPRSKGGITPRSKRLLPPGVRGSYP